MFDDIIKTLEEDIEVFDIWKDMAHQLAKSKDYYTGLLDEIAKCFGEDSYISDDGSVQDSPLRAKMPELVLKLKEEKDKFERSIIVLEDLIKVQCSQGNWDYDPYMHGMANGMILSLSVMSDDKNPQFLDAPKKWGCDCVKRFKQGRYCTEAGKTKEGKNEQKETR